jgi:hypothetical protein
MKRCYIVNRCPKDIREKCKVFILGMTHKCWECEEAFGGQDGKTKEGCYTCKVYLLTHPVLEDETKLSNLYVLMPDKSKEFITARVVKRFHLLAGTKTISGYPILEHS